MRRRVAKLYEIQFLDEDSVQSELQFTLKDSVDCLKETKRALLQAAYAKKDARKLSNRLFKETAPVHIQTADILWAYYSPELTKKNQSLIRSFYVYQVFIEKDRIILFVRFLYEKEKNWFDLLKK